MKAPGIYGQQFTAPHAGGVTTKGVKMFARINGYVRRISGTTSVHAVTDLRTGRSQALNFGGTLAARASDVRIGRGIVRAMVGARRIRCDWDRFEFASFGHDGPNVVRDMGGLNVRGF